MKAVILPAFGSTLELATVVDPTIQGPHDVIVKIAGAGVCGSDIHFIDGMFKDVLGEPPFPYILGHENAGYVAAVGSAVTTVKEGDPVLVHPHITCGTCRACRRGDEAFCEKLMFPGIDGQNLGGFAEYFLTNERALIKLPAGTDPSPMASLSDAGLTAYHAVRRAVPNLVPDGTAVVIGLGGVGYFALQLLRLFTPARIIGVDVSPKKVEEAAKLGADLALLSDSQLVENIMGHTSGIGVDLVLDCVGVAPVPQQSLSMLRRGGVYSALGADNDGDVCCGTMALTGGEMTIKGNLVGNLSELEELVQLVLRSRLHLAQTYFQLGDAAEAIKQLRKGTIQGRAVLVP
jgi:NAD+-dependent secondary alcohol dehydrogenase Adh1|tara:strand:+ start:30366 stop:31406 length:1041 start_codon:yes stop_codon:yes gene_type:complete